MEKSSSLKVNKDGITMNIVLITKMFREIWIAFLELANLCDGFQIRMVNCYSLNLWHNRVKDYFTDNNSPTTYNLHLIHN